MFAVEDAGQQIGFGILLLVGIFVFLFPFFYCPMLRKWAYVDRDEPLDDEPIPRLRPPDDDGSRRKAQTEKVFFETLLGQIRITATRAIFYEEMYALRNVTSVALKRREANPLVALALILVGIIFAYWTWGATLLITFVGILLWLGLKPNYIVLLGSASGEVQGFEIQGKELADKIITALNGAIVTGG
jgi:hypothetical protein